MKKRKCAVLIICMIVLCLGIGAIVKVINSEHFNYTILEDGTACITGYSGKSKCLFVPSEIKGVTVTAIGDNVFSDCKRLTEITLPSSIASIGEMAFLNCKNLTDIIIMDNTAETDDIAFYEDKSDKTNFQAGMTAIGDYAFSGCSSLTEISLGDNITAIGNGSFFNCSSLAWIRFSDSITSIGNEAFSSCSSLTKISLPDNISSIGDGAFSNCGSLTQIDFPASKINYIGEGVVTTPNTFHVTIDTRSPSIQYIRDRLCITKFGDFRYGLLVDGTAYITEYSGESKCLSIPETFNGFSVTSIGANAFSNSMLTQITLPDSITVIGNEAFSDCKDLVSITIPGSVVYIGNDVFSGSDNITIYTVPGAYAEQYAIKNKYPYHLTKGEDPLPAKIPPETEFIFDNQTAQTDFNALLSIFAMQDFKSYYFYDSFDFSDRLNYAMLYAQQHKDEYELIIREYNSENYYLLPFHDVDGILVQVFGHHLLEEQNEYHWADGVYQLESKILENGMFFSEGYFWCPANSPVKHNKIAVVDSLTVNENGSYDVEFEIFRVENESVDSSVYSRSIEEISEDPDFVRECFGSAGGWLNNNGSLISSYGIYYKTVQIENLEPYKECLNMYRDILNAYYDLGNTDTFGNYYDFAETIKNITGVSHEVRGDQFIGECRNMEDFKNSLDYFGFTFKDLNGDWIPELIIGETSYTPSLYDCFAGSPEVYTVFSYRNGRPVHCISAGYRNHYWMMDSGELYNYSYFGPAATYIEIWRIDENCTGIIEEGWAKDYFNGLNGNGHWYIGYINRQRDIDNHELISYDPDLQIDIQPEDYNSSANRFIDHKLISHDLDLQIDMQPEDYNSIANSFIDRTVCLDFIHFSQLERIP